MEGGNREVPKRKSFPRNIISTTTLPITRLSQSHGQKNINDYFKYKIKQNLMEDVLVEEA